MKNDERITTMSVEEARERRARGESRTDLERVRTMSETELETAIAGDPDWRDVPGDWWKDAELVEPVGKKLLSLRLDTDLVDWFKSQGPGYQTRMNAVLRAFMEAKQRTA